jgi:hypothetical protein
LVGLFQISCLKHNSNYVQEISTINFVGR